MFRRFGLFLLLSVMTIYMGCSSGNEVTTPHTTPVNISHWYQEPLPTDSHYIYGLGMGSSRKDAIYDALNNAISTLNVSVSSHYKRTTTLTNSDGQEEFDQSNQENLDIIVKQIPINNYRVLNEEAITAHSYAVLLQINKKELFTSLYNNIENNFKILEIKLQERHRPLDRILLYRKYMAIIKGHMNFLGILRTLDPSFTATHFIEQYKAITKAHNQLVANKHFKLQITDPSHYYEGAIKQGLMVDGVAITDSDRYDYLISVTISEVQKLHIRREVITDLTTKFYVGIRNHNTEEDAFYTQFQLKSSSDISLDDARERNRKVLLDKIEKHGIFNIPRI